MSPARGRGRAHGQDLFDLDYSYRSRNFAGDGFILIGDAYGFLDPIYSSGVLLALKMAELAADSIHDAFNNNDFTGARLGQFQGKLDRGIESMRKLVYAFYNEGFSFAQFLQEVSRSAREHYQPANGGCL